MNYYEIETGNKKDKLIFKNKHSLPIGTKFIVGDVKNPYQVGPGFGHVTDSKGKVYKLNQVSNEWAESQGIIVSAVIIEDDGKMSYDHNEQNDVALDEIGLMDMNQSPRMRFRRNDVHGDPAITICMMAATIASGYRANAKHHQVKGGNYEVMRDLSSSELADKAIADAREIWYKVYKRLEQDSEIKK